MTARPRPQIMTVTDVAAKQIRQVMTSKPEAVALKIGLKKGGCAGMEYTLDWADEVGNPKYILDLLLSVINVSVQTVEIVEGLPKLKFD